MQRAWEEETHGRDTYNFIHDVSFAIRNRTWFVPNRFATYLITGYGPINSTLFKRGIPDENNGPKCGEVNETQDHIIFDCVDYNDIKWPEMSQYRNRRTDLIMNEYILKKFNKFAEKVFEKRNET